jgi:hypothetical protein
MRVPTPTFTPTSKAGAEALASAEAAGEALETAGKRLRFGCGALLGGVVGFFGVANLWATDPNARAWLDRTGLPGYWALVLVTALVIGAATARWGFHIWSPRKNYSIGDPD